MHHLAVGSYLVGARQANTVFTFFIFLHKCNCYLCLLCFYLVRYRNELLGLEGMVKIKNPDEQLVNGSSIICTEPNPKSGGADADPKR